DNAVAESNEGNNYVSVQITVESPSADLHISTGTPTATPSTVAPGGTVTLSAWTVRNQGGASTGVGFSNGFYLSTNSTITTGDTYLDENGNSALAPGASFDWGGPTLTIPGGTTPGTYYLGILVDKDNAVAESNEGNNYVSVSLTVGTPSDVQQIDDSKIPNHFALFQNYPNPFNPSTNIQYGLPKGSHVRITIHNTLGQRLRTLVDMEHAPGTFLTVWDGASSDGQSVSAGVYFLRFQAGEYVETRKMSLVK
ncbi:MAG: CARDB domain-containing protein, partial [Bacteroidota bacterium]